jgi:hypothetical protein
VYVVKRFRAVEVATTSLALWWGLILILPFDTFSSSSSYKAMAGIASEPCWGLFMLAIGTAQLFGMILNNYFIKRYSLLLATGIWVFISAMFGLSTFFSTASGTYFIIACLTGWLYMKVGGQFEHRQ